MKKQIPNTFYLSITVISFIFIGCSKDKPCNNDIITQDIYANVKSQFIYKGNEKLTFINVNTKDTHTFNGQGLIKDYGTSQSSGAGGCSHTYKLERNYIIFKSPTFSSSITATLLYYDIEGIPYLEINFNKTIYIASGGSIRKPFDYDSLFIQGNQYYNIEYFTNEYKPNQAVKYGCYYNLNQGVIKMETNDGSVWELIKIE
jgi:hypothetical protein